MRDYREVFFSEELRLKREAQEHRVKMSWAAAAGIVIGMTLGVAHLFFITFAGSVG
jgi:hypothetical protein